MSQRSVARHPAPAAGPWGWLTVQARNQPDARCLVDVTGRTVTFGEMDRAVDRLAHVLAAHGVGKGDRIGILATDSIEYMQLLLASMRLGATYVPLNYRFAPAEIANLARYADLRAFVTMGRYAEVVEAVREACPNLRLVASFDEVDGLPRLDELVAATAEDASPPPVDIDPEDIVGLMFTSGTTGFPKGVLQSFRMLQANTIAGIIDLRLRPDDFRYSASPMFHVAGMGCIYYGIARGFASLVMPQYDAATLLHWLQHGGITGVLLMPTMLHDLLQLPDVRHAKYPALRSIMYGGAPMSPALLREALEVFDCDFYNTFGAGTEAGGQAVFTPEDHLRALAGEEHLLGSIGKPMFGVELRLVDSAMRDVPRGSIGEICTRSEAVMSGYLGDPERTAEALSEDGWFRAGDLAYMDDEGYLFLAGRRSDMIIRGGENVYPVEIESVIADHPAVDDVAVVGLPDEHWGEIVAAVIEPVEGATVDADDIRAHCRARLAAYKVPAVVVVMHDMPRNVNGKVEKHRLVELVTAQAPERSPSPDPPTTQENRT